MQTTIRVMPFQHQAPFITVRVTGHTAYKERRAKAYVMAFSICFDFSLVQTSMLSFGYHKKSVRHGAGIILLMDLLYRHAHGLQAAGRVQIIEVSLCAVQGRADSQLAADGLCGFGGRLHTGVPCLAVLHGLAIVVSAEDNLPVGILVTSHAGHGFEVPGVEGHKAGVARGKVQACGGGIAFRYEQRTVLASVLCRDGEATARRLTACEKDLVRPLSGLFRQDALQAHQLAGSIQNGQQQFHHAPPLPLSDSAEDWDMFALQIGVVVRSGHGFFPDILGLFGSIGPTSGLLCFGILAGSGDAFPQGLAFGRCEVFVRGSRAGPFITAAPVLPPAAGRGIQMDTVGAVLAAWLVCCAAAVQRPVSLDMFHQQPGSSQALREGGQDFVVHGLSCGPLYSGMMIVDVLSGRPASHGGRLRGSRAQGLPL